MCVGKSWARPGERAAGLGGGGTEGARCCGPADRGLVRHPPARKELTPTRAAAAIALCRSGWEGVRADASPRVVFSSVTGEWQSLLPGAVAGGGCGPREEGPPGRGDAWFSPPGSGGARVDRSGVPSAMDARTSHRERRVILGKSEVAAGWLLLPSGSRLAHPGEVKAAASVVI